MACNRFDPVGRLFLHGYPAVALLGQVPEMASNNGLPNVPLLYRRGTFRGLLAEGDKDTIFTVLKWVVPQPQELQKRAFVGYYLSFPDVRGEESGEEVRRRGVAGSGGRGGGGGAGGALSFPDVRGTL